MESETRRPKDGWRQLDFKTTVCLPSPRCSAIAFGVIFIISSVLTCVILPLSYQITEKSTSLDSLRLGSSSTSTLTLTENFSGPVYIYLAYMDYHQNHRIYLKSKSKYQLSGSYDSTLSTDCDPLEYQGEIDLKIGNYAEGETILPCGLMPASFVNISMRVTNNDTPVSIDSSGIAWPSDNSNKYLSQTGEYLDISNPHFKVWMRSALTKDFRKIYGKVSGFSKGQVNFYVEATTTNYLGYYPEMMIILSTTTRLGGKNFVLGWCFFIISVISFAWCIIFLVFAKYSKIPTLKEFYTKKIENR